MKKTDKIKRKCWKIRLKLDEATRKKWEAERFHEEFWSHSGMFSADRLWNAEQKEEQLRKRLYHECAKLRKCLRLEARECF